MRYRLGATLADVTKLNAYMADCTPAALEVLTVAAIEVGADFPITANTLAASQRRGSRPF